MTAPTEQEIRAAVRAALDDSDIDIGEWVHELVAPISYSAPSERGEAYEPALWDDLRPSQAALLQSLIEVIYTKSDALQNEVLARIEDYVVEAGLAFAAEHPDAPRAKVPVEA
jgi:hypothetical protein